MYRSVLKMVILTIAFVGSVSAHADQYDDVLPNQVRAPMWVDLRDVSRYSSSKMKDATVIVDSISKQWSKYGIQGEQVYGTIALQQRPEKSGATAINYKNMSVFIKKSDATFAFRVFNVLVDGAPGARSVVSVETVREVSLAESDFSINAAIAEQQVVLEDQKNDIRMIYPIGVGGIDPGLITKGNYESLTPLFSNGKIEKKYAYTRRTAPAYYRGQPFMPITNKAGHRTSIAFHITILSDRDWKSAGPNYLVRGYDSHGCMRLRQKDLSEMANILFNGSKDSIPVNVTLFMKNSAQYANLGTNPVADSAEGIIRQVHPYPYNMKFYQRVKNFNGTYQRDAEEHLVITEKAAGIVDITKLTAFSVDDMSLEEMRKVLAEDAGAASAK